MAPHPGLYRALPQGGTTTRHAASLRSSNNCKGLIEAFMISRGEGP